MTFSRPSLSDLIERGRQDVETRLPGADSRLRQSVLDVFARMHGGAAAGLYGYLDFIARQIMPDTAEGEFLARWAAIWGIARKAATPAQITTLAAGVNGSPIAVGAELQRADGALYRVMAATVIVGGSAALAIEAVDSGTAGNVDAGTALTFTSPVPGVNADTAVVSLDVAGTDDELDESLLARLLDRIQQPPMGGAANDYVQWALAQPGVTRAWAYAQWMGLGTVGLTFVMDARDNVIPLEADIASVQAALDILRPVTAELVVFAPSTRAVDFGIRVSPDTPAIRAAISAELADFFAREAEPGGTLYASRMDEAISLAEGEFRHDRITPAGDETGDAGELLVLGEVMFL